MPAKPLSPEQLEDASRLEKIFLERQQTDPSLTQESLAHACGWKTQGSVNQYIKGKIPLNLPAVLKFSNALKVQPHDISPTLAGMMEIAAKKPPSAPASSTKFKKVVEFDPADDGLVQIRRVKLRLSAGITGFAAEEAVEDAQPLAYRREWFVKRGYSPAKLIAINVKGESMEPSLSDGDTVVINTADTIRKHGELYAINYDGEAVVKRLVRDIGRWFLASDNPDQRRYHRQECTEGTCIVIGRIVQIIKDL